MTECNFRINENRGGDRKGVLIIDVKNAGY